jgi:hypothetical protein
VNLKKINLHLFLEAEKLKDACASTIQCRHLDAAATCNSFFRECRCNSLNVESEDLTMCLKSKHRNNQTSLEFMVKFTEVNILGGTCDENAQCNTPSSECKLVGSEKVCACMSGMVSSANTCLLGNFSRFCFTCFWYASFSCRWNWCLVQGWRSVPMGTLWMQWTIWRKNVHVQKWLRVEHQQEEVPAE